MEEKKSLPFGKKLRARNFTVLKYTKSLKPSELKQLRDAKGIPADVQKHLKRGCLPYIKIMTLSEDFGVEFICGSTMFRYIDGCPMADQDTLTEESINALHNLCVMMYADCTIMGDTEYLENKAKNLKAYMERNKAKAEETAAEKAADDKVLEELKKEHEAKSNIIEMGKEIEKEVDNESRKRDS